MQEMSSLPSHVYSETYRRHCNGAVADKDGILELLWEREHDRGRKRQKFENILQRHFCGGKARPCTLVGILQNTNCYRVGFNEEFATYLLDQKLYSQIKPPQP